MTTMASYLDYLEEVADPRVKQWMFMSSPWSIISLLAAYIYVVKKAGPEYMKNKKPYNLKRIIQMYNLVQICSCSAVVVSLVVNGCFTTMSFFKCYPVDFSNNPVAVNLVTISWWAFMLKILDLTETIFFVLRKKYSQVSILHVYHHSIMLIFGWLGVKFVGGGMASFWTLINYSVHVLMYTYYFMSTFGPEWQKRLRSYKPKLTIIQMIQFTALLIHCFIIFSESCEFKNKFVMYSFLPNLVTIYYLFYEFYQLNYAKKVKAAT